MFRFFKPIVTEHTTELFNELKKLGVNAILEYNDGHKHIDIAILDARIFIEVDGLNHYTNAEQIERDFKRNHYSDGDDFDTIHIPNLVIEHHRVAIARAIEKIVRKRCSPNPLA